MVWEVVLYTLGIYIIVKYLILLIFRKPVLKKASKLLKNKKAMNVTITIGLILGVALIAAGYLFFR